MKKLSFLLSLFLLTAIVSHAQYKWAGGYQLGVGNLNNPIPSGLLDNDPASKPQITNQLFINKSLTKKLNLQLAVGYTAFKSTREYTAFTNPITTSHYSNCMTIINFSLAVKWNIYQKKNWDLFVPFGINNTYTESQEKYEYATTNTTSQKQFLQGIFTGLGMNYSLNKRIYLNTQGFVGMKVNDLFGDMKVASNNDSYLTYGFLIGIGYCF